MNVGSGPSAAGSADPLPGRSATLPYGRDGWIFAAVVSVFAAAFLWLHLRAGLAFPVPWPDESSFLWPAIAFQEGTTLFTPELNPDRHVLWMPPGYAVVLGSIFKLTGFSLACARAISALCLIGALAFLAGAVRELRFRYPALLVVCLVFLGRHFVMMGNFARMESLLVLAVAAAAFALVRRDDWSALAILLIAPLIHPNGAYPAAAMAAYVAGRTLFRRAPGGPSRTAIALLVVAAAAWAAYVVYVAQHWGAFENDMRYQVSWKGQPGPLEAAFWIHWVDPARLATTALLAILAIAGAALGSPAASLAVPAIALHLLPTAPGDWYYEILHGLVFVLFAAIALDLAGRAFGRLGADRGPLRGIVLAGSLGLAVGSGFVLGWIESPMGFPHSMRVAGMRFGAEAPYLDAESERAVREFLGSLGTAESPVTVRFFPWADALLFHDLRSERLRFIHPTFYTAEADIGVTHLSPLVPEIRGFFDRERMTRRTAAFPRIHARSDTDQWLYERDPAPVTHGRLRGDRR